MLILLSSGTRERYLDDIVRSLALPAQTEIQFRYSRSWLSQQVTAKIADGSIRNERALICYIDQSTVGAIHIIPCRMARIVEVTNLGSSLAIQLSVDDLPKYELFDQIQKGLSNNPDCPKWNGKKISGKWFFEQSDFPSTAVQSFCLENWERVVSELLARNDFATKHRDFFFHVLGIRLVSNGVYVVPADNVHNLKSSENYELVLYHYHSSADSSVKTVSLVSSNESVVLTSLERVRVDSRYDLKTWQFFCEGGLRATPLTLEVRTGSTLDPKDDVVQIGLAAKVGIDGNSLFIRLPTIAVGLAISSLATLAATDKLTMGAAAVCLIGALTAAVGTIWKTK
jgi:hypothetical protein